MAENHCRSLTFFILTILFVFSSTATFAATYEYDDLNRLEKYVSAGIQTDYTYDENGNRESKAVVGLLPSVSIQINKITNEVALTVTAGSSIVDYVYIDWVDGTDKTGDPADIAAGASRNYVHNYSLLRESIYQIRVKLRTMDGNYHYLTVKAQTY